jgi:hypothetical protein
MNDHFGVAICLEDGAAMLKFATPLGGIGEISIVADGEFAFAAINYDWLRVHQAGVTGGGITRVADGGIAGKSCEALGIENIRDETETFRDVKIGAVRRTNSGGFLSTMLLGVKTEIGKFRSFRMRENAENSTVIVEVVVVELEVLRHVF